MTAATFRTTCARCAAPLGSTDATAGAVSKAHEEWCFVVGDYVRWDYAGNWTEGKLASISKPADCQVAHIDVIRTSFGAPALARYQILGLGGSATLRRIPRPEQAVKLEFSSYGDNFIVHHDIKLSPEGQAVLDRLRAHYGLPRLPTPPAADPLDVKYDGLGLRELLCRDQLMRQGDCMGTGATPWPSLTVVQRTAVSAHWSAQLRARVNASKERERLTVVAPDLELETANCKDAE